MSVTYIGVGSNSGNAASGTVVTHASTLAGDLLVMLTNSGSTVSSITGGSGGIWAKLGSTISTSNALTNLEVWTKPAAAADIGATLTVNYNASAQFDHAVASWRGQGVPAVVNFQSIVSNVGATAAITAPSWNASLAGAMAWGGANTFGLGPNCLVTGASWTEILDINNALVIASDAAVDSTSTGSGLAGCTFTWNGNNTSRAAITFNVISPGGGALFFGSL